MLDHTFEQTRQGSFRTSAAAPPRHTLTLGLCAGLTAGLVSGCDQIGVEKRDTAAQEPARGSEAAETAKKPSPSEKDISDEDIEHAVMHRLFVEGVFPTAHVDVEVDNGIVKMSGAALSLYAKNQAEEVVRSTKGVRGYLDAVKVIDAEISDTDLQTNVQEALLFDPATESYEIDARAKKGVVELTGEVDSWAEHQLAVEVVAGVLGVREIENRLSIKTPPVRPAREIEAEIERRLKNDVLVDTALLNVKVDAGVVQLSGIIGSDAERARAVSKAWVSGVSRVDAEDLQVEWWNRDRFENQDSHVFKPDIEIKAAVKDALGYDARINHDDIEVYVNRGRVTLTGTVPGLRSKNQATETAQNTLGVTRVRNYLRVDPKEDLDDQQLEERVDRALHFNPYLANWTGAVTAKNGIVTLEGMVNTPQQKEQAEAIVSRVIGVTHVENEIDVYLQEMEDLTLIDDVEEALLWNVYVDLNDVDVAASRGMVTLSGKVDDLRAYRSAVQAARDAGAEVVYNRMDIESKDS